MVWGRKTRGRVEKGPHPYSNNRKLLISLWGVTTTEVKTIADLLRISKEKLSLEAADVLILAVTFLSQDKLKGDGSRNAKKIYEHAQLGFGERLTPDHPIKSDVLITLRTIISRSVTGNSLHKDLRHELKAARFHAHAVVLDLLELLLERLRWGSNPPKLPLYLR